MNHQEHTQVQAVGALRPSAAATYLGIGRTHLYQLLNAGEIPSAAVGKVRLIRVVDLDNFLARIVDPQSAA